ncbi:hypothetical protein Bca101_001533 [Brassica carinata]
MGKEHEGGYASTSDEHRRQGDSVIRVITTVACPCQPIELSPVYLQSIAVSEALPIEIPDGGEVEISGSPTEKAILSCAYKGRSLLSSMLSLSIIWRSGGDSSGLLYTIHGLKWYPAAQLIARRSFSDLAKNSLRCVAIACRTQELNKVPKEQEDLDKWSLLEDELTLLAIVGIKDPCRPGVREAVRTCTSAGVKVDPTKTPEALLWIRCSMDPKTVSEEGEEKHH